MAKIYTQVGKKNRAEKHHKWKGDDASYSAKHYSVVTIRSKPRFCQICGSRSKKRYHWANIDHKYSRDPEQYIRLCTKCHVKYDKTENKEQFTLLPIPEELIKPRNVVKERMMVAECKICGKRMKKNQFQKRKRTCTKCAYELKKVRIEARYWMKKDPESTRAKFWEGRLKILLNQLKNK